MPFDVIKIDKVFISELDKGCVSSAAMIEAIVFLAKKHGMTCLAEGVESEEQSRLLLNNGCEVVQGHYFSKALSMPDFKNFMFCMVNDCVGTNLIKRSYS